MFSDSDSDGIAKTPFRTVSDNLITSKRQNQSRRKKIFDESSSSSGDNSKMSNYTPLMFVKSRNRNTDLGYQTEPKKLKKLTSLHKSLEPGRRLKKKVTFKEEVEERFISDYDHSLSDNEMNDGSGKAYSGKNKPNKYEKYPLQNTNQNVRTSDPTSYSYYLRNYHQNKSTLNDNTALSPQKHPPKMEQQNEDDLDDFFQMDVGTNVRMRQFQFGSEKRKHRSNIGFNDFGKRNRKTLDVKTMADDSENVSGDLDQKLRKKELKMKKDYGRGYNLLKGIGFNVGEGLGKHNQGIVEPIIAKKRPDRQGLNFNDYSEHSKEDKEVLTQIRESHLQEKTPNWKRKKEDDDEFDDLQTFKKQRETRNKEFAEQRKLLRKKKRQEVRQEYENYKKSLESIKFNKGKLNDKIIDMTGEVPSVISDYSALNSGSVKEKKESCLLGLKKDLNFYTEQTKYSLEDLDRKIKNANDEIVSYNYEKQTLLNEISSTEEKLANLDEFQNEVKKILDLPKETETQMLTFISHLNILHCNYPKHFAAYKIISYATNILKRKLKKLYKNWNIPEKPELHISLIKSFSSCLERTLEPSSPQSQTKGESSPFSKSDSNPGDSLSSLLLASLLNDSFYPEIRRFIVSLWDPHNPLPLLPLLSAWKPIIPSFLQNTILHTLILPKLEQAIAQFNPRTQINPIHLWVHPWLPFLSHNLNDFLVKIKQRFVIALKECDIADPAVRNMLQPWRIVFSQQMWDDFMLRSVVPKLNDAVMSVVVNPKAQEVSGKRGILALKNVFAWAEFIQIEHFISIFEEFFFDNWLGVLKKWLKQKDQANYHEILEWYSGWKAFFPPVMLENERIKTQFGYALQLMNKYVK